MSTRKLIRREKTFDVTDEEGRRHTLHVDQEYSRLPTGHIVQGVTSLVDDRGQCVTRCSHGVYETWEGVTYRSYDPDAP